ncbi:MAG: ComF family protein [Ktedonobacterales bacterium]|nr:ComF family protein [Ktedonobacterales bacterium]
MLQGLTDALFPPRCVGCGTRGMWLCATCRATIAASAPHSQCPHGVAVTYCARCSPDWTDLSGVRVVGPYEPPLKSAIWALKFTGKRGCAAALGQLLAQQWSRAPAIPVDAIVAVPPSAAGQRQRGYNQAELLARACATSLALPLWPRALGRTRAADPQLGKTAIERHQNAQGLFAATPRVAAQMVGRRILVVDDVLTTGATLNAAATALRAAGAVEVWGVVLARPRTHER